MWRFRPKLWHRDNALVLAGLVVLGAVIAIKVTAGRSVLPFFMPLAAVGLILAILLGAGPATVVKALVAVVGGAANGAARSSSRRTRSSADGGIIVIRRGDRFHVFVQAGVAIAVVNAAVVTIFSLLGARDLTGMLAAHRRIGRPPRAVRPSRPWGPSPSSGRSSGS